MSAFLLALLACGDDAPPEAVGREVCGNGADDDGDLVADCDDPECGCPEACDNLRDDNGDGLLDCEDPDCADACTEDCFSRDDEDRDGLVDCDDPDCPGACLEDCRDGEDEDGDGLADCDDPDCAPECDADADGHAGEAYGGADCDDGDGAVHPDADEWCNGLDDDCDGAVDDDDDEDPVDAVVSYVDDDLDAWGDDAKRLVRCAEVPLTVPTGGDCDDADPDVNPDAAEVCNGGVDDDCDGLADDLDEVDPSSALPLYADGDLDGVGAPPSIGLACGAASGESLASDDCDDADPDAYPGAPEPCGGSVDLDCDGEVTECPGCADVVLTGTLPIAEAGTTSGSGDDTAPSCVPSNAPDVAFLWTPPAVGAYTIDTAGSAFDTTLYVLASCGGVELACNDDDPTLGLQSRVQVVVAAVTPLVIVVDGYSNAAGAFVLNVY